ncbi:MAG: WD40 repeat domain-containing protein [Candidatus Babeliales bacterium]|jgi:WD40 repeat protein
MKFFFCLIVILVQLLNVTNSGATSLIYTSNTTNYQANNYVFRKNDIAQGFVRLSNGFTVLPDACATMDLLFSVSGAIDLRETGTMKLLRDCVFDSAVTLSSGGNIKGYGHAIILNGNLTIPTGKVLHISGDTIIDGQGNKLTIGANAQIFVDTNVTLTLCNMLVTNQQHALTFPPLRCGAQTSKLALDNVTFTPVGNFLFPQGQLFIHNDVAVTGTSAFIYTSPMPSYITSGACWYFDINTTLSVAPATFTDAPYTLKTTYTNNNFIRMSDATSMLVFDGCSLQTTLTGCRFTKGTIAFDNKVACRSDTTLTLTSITLRAKQDYGTSVVALNWSPDGKYLAISGYGPTSGNEVQVYAFDGSSLTLVTSLDYGSYALGVNWSPDGRYLAICGKTPTSGKELQVYAFNGSSLTLVASIDYGNAFYTVNWSPDGRYLAFGGVGPISGDDVQVYAFDGSSLTLVASLDYGGVVYTVNCSPDGRYIAIGGNAPTGGNEVQVYAFDGSSLTLVTSLDYGGIVFGVNWSPDGRYLAVVGSGPTSGNEIQIYSFSGSSLTLVSSTDFGDAGSSVNMVNWSPDGRYIAICGTGAISENEVEVYAFSGSSLTPVSSIDFVGAAVNTVSWRPDGRYLAIGGQIAGTGHEEVYTCDYVNNTITQALSNSIVFGDSAKGSTYDARVNVLAGARVNLFGAMSYDGINAVLLGDEEQ